MNINFKESFTNFTKDPGWIKRFVVLALLGYFVDILQNYIINTSVYIVVLKYLLSVPYFGIMILYIHNIVNNKKPIIPDFKFYIKKGIWAYFALVFYALLVFWPLFIIPFSRSMAVTYIYAANILIYPVIIFAWISFAEKFEYKKVFNLEFIFTRIEKVLFPFLILIVINGLLIYYGIRLNGFMNTNLSLTLNIIIGLFYSFIKLFIELVKLNFFIQVYNMSQKINIKD